MKPSRGNRWKAASKNASGPRAQRSKKCPFSIPQLCSQQPFSGAGFVVDLRSVIALLRSWHEDVPTCHLVCVTTVGEFCRRHCLPALPANDEVLQNFPTDVAESVNSQLSGPSHEQVVVPAVSSGQGRGKHRPADVDDGPPETLVPAARCAWTEASVKSVCSCLALPMQAIHASDEAATRRPLARRCACM